MELELYTGPVKHPETFTKVEIGEPTTLDPARAYDTRSWEIIFNTYETLVNYSLSRQAFTPRLAATIPSIENGLIRDDGRTYIFPIRRGVFFHDGSALTPEDVTYSLRRLLLTDAPRGPSWLLLEPLLGVHTFPRRQGVPEVDIDALLHATQVEGDTVVFRLRRPFAPFLSILSTPVTSILNKRWAVEHGAWPDTAESARDFCGREEADSALATQCNGTGPFRFVRWEREHVVELERFPGYWRAPATLKRVRILRENDWQGRKALLGAGEADMVQTDRLHVPEIEGQPGSRIYDDLTILVCDGIGFNFNINVEENPVVGSGRLDGHGIPGNFFSDLHVRRGFNYAFDWERLIRDTYHGKGRQMLGPIPEGLFGFDPDQPRYSYDPQAAVAELKQAFDGQLWERGFHMIAHYNAGNLLRRDAPVILQENLKRLNPRFSLEVQAIEFPAYLKALREHKLSLFTTGWLVDYPDPHDFVYPLLSAHGQYGDARQYEDPEIEGLIADGLASTDPSWRLRIYSRLQRLAYERAVDIYTVQPVGLGVLRSWVQGWEHDLITGPQAVTTFYLLKKA